MTIESFSLFFDAEQRVATRNTKVHHIINFFTFLTEVKKSALTFGVSDLSSFLISTKVLKKDSEAGAAKPLNIEDIILIRNFLKNDYRKLFLFEMVYQYGFEFDDLVQCTEDNYDFDLGVVSWQVQLEFLFQCQDMQRTPLMHSF
ncbi:hypothetical protein IDH44_09665 [Paenibacillus sp. IB182496]|uniref:Uncharacterized protein n=1 Tax=Paenibacillus sabuli TaxID=2772509 RepID=A0A927BRJ4_9BACL|nr:hypothetical protein [Paenibacillus sabuli]MBD2845456.1 hypothetical protein [Paenibacillus sabuli]